MAQPVLVDLVEELQVPVGVPRDLLVLAGLVVELQDLLVLVVDQQVQLVLVVLVEEDHPALQDQRVWADLVSLQDLLVHLDLAYVAGAHQDPLANQA